MADQNNWPDFLRGWVGEALRHRGLTSVHLAHGSVPVLRADGSEGTEVFAVVQTDRGKEPLSISVAGYELEREVDRGLVVDAWLQRVGHSRSTDRSDDSGG